MLLPALPAHNSQKVGKKLSGIIYPRTGNMIQFKKERHSDPGSCVDEA